MEKVEQTHNCMCTIYMTSVLSKLQWTTGGLIVNIILTYFRIYSVFAPKKISTNKTTLHL